MGSLLTPAQPELLAKVVEARYNHGALPRKLFMVQNPANRLKGAQLAYAIQHPDMRVFGVFSGVIGWYGGGDTPNILPW